MDQPHIRNFSIIAHIDHGKSTLADRILELTHTVAAREMRAQVLDSMDLERERGITIKAQAVRVFYTARDGQTYQLNLIDTPGHVDFTYEVSRSLAACEGALLVVDATQGVEAQTVANTYLAIDTGLEMIPCLNKIDLPGAEPERVAGEVSELIGEPADVDPADQRQDRRGRGGGARELIARVPAPAGDPDGPPRALIFDSRVRPVPRRDRLHPGRRRRVPQGRGDPRDGDGHGGGDRRDRLLQPADDARRAARRRRGRLPDHRRQGRHPAARRRHAHRQASARPREAAAGLPRGQADGLLRAVPDRLRRLPRPARRAREAEAQRRRAHLGARDLATRSGSASAAASSACCTWTSCASGSSASTTSSCSRRCRTSSTR